MREQSPPCCKFPAFFDDSINTRADLKGVLDAKSSNARGVFAIKMSGCVSKRFCFRPQILRTTGCQGRSGILDGKKQTATTEAAAAFHSHSRTNPIRLTYGRGERT